MDCSLSEQFFSVNAEIGKVPEDSGTGLAGSSNGGTFEGNGRVPSNFAGSFSSDSGATFGEAGVSRLGSPRVPLSSYGVPAK